MPAPYTGPRPNRVSTSSLKSRILHLAQTSVYQVKMQPPSTVVAFLGERNFNYYGDGQDVELKCSEATLPGTSLATHDVTNDFAGVTEKMAYRRIYDETIDLTFYVDNNYDTIEFFDGWVDYIANGSFTDRGTMKDPTAFYRMNYPDTYKSNIYLTKFEKDVGRNRSKQLNYTFVNAFPISVGAMPVSYGPSDTLRCTVSFSYMRYIREREFVERSRRDLEPSRRWVREFVNEGGGLLN